MIVSLRPLRAREFDDWYVRSRAGCAADIEQHAGLARDDAERKATADFARLFPDGREAMRGRGLGRRAMELAEEEANRRGLARIELNVFGGNEVARGLYRSLGYAEVAV